MRFEIDIPENGQTIDRDWLNRQKDKLVDAVNLITADQVREIDADFILKLMKTRGGNLGNNALTTPGGPYSNYELENHSTFAGVDPKDIIKRLADCEEKRTRIVARSWDLTIPTSYPQQTCDPTDHTNNWDWEAFVKFFYNNGAGISPPPNCNWKDAIYSLHMESGYFIIDWAYDNGGYNRQSRIMFHGNAWIGNHLDLPLNWRWAWPSLIDVENFSAGIPVALHKVNYMRVSQKLEIRNGLLYPSIILDWWRDEFRTTHTQWERFPYTPAGVVMYDRWSKITVAPNHVFRHDFMVKVDEIMRAKLYAIFFKRGA